MTTQIPRLSSAKPVVRRLFTTSSFFQSIKSKVHVTKATEDNDIDLQKALDLLSPTRTSLLSKLALSSGSDMSESEKAKYINYFAKVLNNDIKQSKQNDKDYTEHFSQSLSGLNQILSSSINGTIASGTTATSSIITELDNKSARSSHPFSSLTRKELIGRFDNFINSDKLTLRYFSIILAKAGNDYETLNYILTKINFMNRDHRYDSFKILVCTKALQLLSSSSTTNEVKSNLNSLIQDMKKKDLPTWIELRNQEELNKVLEKSLYQIINKVSKSTLSKPNGLFFTSYQFTLLIESLPSSLSLISQVYNQQCVKSQNKLSLALSSNQSALYEFIKFLSSNRGIFPPGKFAILQRKLIKLSIDNHIHKEVAVSKTSVEPNLTVHKYRFRNGLAEILESLENLEIFSNKDLSGLRSIVELNSDVVYKETVLKFI